MNVAVVLADVAEASHPEKLNAWFVVVKVKSGVLPSVSRGTITHVPFAVAGTPPVIVDTNESKFGVFISGNVASRV
jgi:hypothetical protein